MTAPDKPGLSNEEFIDFNQKFLEKASTKGLRNMLNVDMVLAQTLKEALDRLEALIGQGQEERGKPTAQGCGYKWYELKERLKKDPKLDPYDEVGIAMEIMEMES